MVFDARQVEVAGATLRESEAGQHHQRNPDDELETAILGPDESLQNDLGREISAVGAGELVHEDHGRDERERRQGPPTRTPSDHGLAGHARDCFLHWKACQRVDTAARSPVAWPRIFGAATDSPWVVACRGVSVRMIALPILLLADRSPPPSRSRRPLTRSCCAAHVG